MNFDSNNRLYNGNGRLLLCCRLCVQRDAEGKHRKCPAVDFLPDLLTSSLSSQLHAWSLNLHQKPKMLPNGQFWLYIEQIPKIPCNRNQLEEGSGKRVLSDRVVQCDDTTLPVVFTLILILIKIMSISANQYQTSSRFADQTLVSITRSWSCYIEHEVHLVNYD